MAYNYVEIFNPISLDFGLNTRVDRSKYQFASDHVIYAQKTSSISSQTAISNVSNSYYFPSSAIACSIVSSNSGDTSQSATIQYYEDENSEEATTQDISLNGTTPVSLSNNIFRLKLILLNNNTSGNITIYETATPSNIIGSVENGYKFSHLPFFYAPPNRKCILYKIDVYTDCYNDGKAINIIAKRYPSYLAPSYYFTVQELPIYENFNSTYLTSQPAFNERTTYSLECKKHAGLTNPSYCLVAYSIKIFKQ